MLLRKKNASAQNPGPQQGVGVAPAVKPPTKTQLAVKQRAAQGRAPLDHWDMFANVMATRNALPKSHPSHLSLRAVTKATATEVHRATDGTLPMPDKVKVRDEAGHASTGGGYSARKDRTKPITLTMKKNYGKRALEEITRDENTDSFRKLVRTVGHEMAHVAQRKSPAVMKATTSPQREMEAYGSEILSHPRLPALQGPQLQSTAKKFRKQAAEVTDPGGHLSAVEEDRRRLVAAQLDTGRGVGM